jgi:hypothetical protein
MAFKRSAVRLRLAPPKPKKQEMQLALQKAAFGRLSFLLLTCVGLAAEGEEIHEG